jgi:hypothetical protein
MDKYVVLDVTDKTMTFCDVNGRQIFGTQNAAENAAQIYREVHPDRVFAVCELRETAQTEAERETAYEREQEERQYRHDVWADETFG